MGNVNLKYKPRKEQLEILDFFSDSVKSGKKFITIDAPTGIGKSYAIMMMIQWFLDNKDPNAKFDILTNTKLLQTQYIKDFPFLNSLKGKENYYCRQHKCSCDEGQEINKYFGEDEAEDEVPLFPACKACPYKMDLMNFLGNTIALTNFHLYCSFIMYVPTLLEDRKAKILFIDEAHSFDDIISEFLASEISYNSLKSIFSDVKEDYVNDMVKRIKTIGDYAKILSQEIIPALEKELQTLQANIKSENEMSRKTSLIKRYKLLDRSMCKYNRILKYGNGNWVFEKGKDYVKVEPLWSYTYLKSFIWDMYDHVVCLSGTILDKDLFAFLMGFDTRKMSYMQLQSPFERKNRMIFYHKNVGKLSYDEIDKNIGKALKQIAEILEKNKGKKGIIHTGNYKISNLIKEAFEDDRLLIHGPENRELMYEEHLNSTTDTVLVSPSMLNGVDLKDDLSRFQVIVKVPYPSLMNQKTKLRMKVRPSWYSWKALGNFIQGYGRSIRNYDDYAETHVTDGCLDTLLKFNNKIIPNYIKEAIEKV